MNEINKTEGTAQKVKQLLDQRGLKYSWFATQLGVTSHTISRYLSGKSAIPKSKHQRIADILAVTPAEIFDDNIYQSNTKIKGGNEL